MSLKDFLRDITPSGILEHRRAVSQCAIHGLVPAPGIGIRRAAFAGKMCGAMLFKPHWIAGISDVIDVGANVGQWTSYWTSVQQPRRILSLEPNPECFKKLQEKARNRPGWECANCAGGESEGTMTFNVPRDSTSASLLDVKSEMGWNSKEEIENPRKITVQLKRVDQLAADWPEVSLLKVDAEGYELNVLAGATGIFKKTKYILVELTWFERFKDGSTIWNINEFLEQHGFRFWNLGESNIYGGRAVFCDGLFVRNDLIA